MVVRRGCTSIVSDISILVPELVLLLGRLRKGGLVGRGVSLEVGFESVKQWFSTFLMLQPFNTVPRVVVTPNQNVVFIATA